MYISILNKPKSKVRSKSISVNRGKSVSFSKIANKKQMIKTSETDKKIDMTNNT